MTAMLEAFLCTLRLLMWFSVERGAMFPPTNAQTDADRVEFINLYLAHYDELFAFARGKCGGSGSAEDFVAEAYERGEPKYLSSKHSRKFCNWMKTIIKNLIIDDGRRRKNQMIVNIDGINEPLGDDERDSPGGVLQPIVDDKVSRVVLSCVKRIRSLPSNKASGWDESDVALALWLSVAHGKKPKDIVAYLALPETEEFRVRVSAWTRDYRPRLWHRMFLHFNLLNPPLVQCLTALSPDVMAQFTQWVYGSYEPQWSLSVKDRHSDEYKFARECEQVCKEAVGTVVVTKSWVEEAGDE